MKPTNITMLLLLILGILAIGATQERQRLLDWFEDLVSWRQWAIGTALVLFFIFAVAWIFCR